MLDLARLKQLCQEARDLGAISPRFKSEAAEALPALVEELERVYAVLAKTEDIRVARGVWISPSRNVPGTFVVYVKNKAEWEGDDVKRHGSIREALHRAWELEKQTKENA